MSDPLSITVVEDDSSFRRALRRLLTGAGFTVATFASAEEFLASNPRDSVDCLIVDVHLPGMTGPALVQKLSDAGTPLPAVIITAHDDARTLELIRLARPVDHLRKPFSDDDLFGAIRTALSA